MKHKLYLSKGGLITFEEACNRYIDYYRYRSLREDTSAIGKVTNSGTAYFI